MCTLDLTAKPAGRSATPDGLVGAGAPQVLFKRDRPRAIDRFIDYFGDSPPRAMPCDLPAMEVSA